MFTALRKIFSKEPVKDETEGWPSIVLLLKEPLLPSREEALEMARTAWGAAGDVDIVGCVGAHNYVVRASTLRFAIHAVSSPYEVDAGKLAQTTELCWTQHKAWLSVDMPNRSITVLRGRDEAAGAYLSLMYFVSKHWSPNILGVYFPSERTTVPNFGDLPESIRWAARNGINLSFLKDKKRD